MENTAKYEFIGKMHIINNNGSEHEVKHIEHWKNFRLLIAFSTN